MSGIIVWSVSTYPINYRIGQAQVRLLERLATSILSNHRGIFEHASVTRVIKVLTHTTLQESVVELCEIDTE